MVGIPYNFIVKAMKTDLRTLAALVALAAMCLQSVRADVVTDWNAQIRSVIDSQSAQSPNAARDMAVLNVAMYNAIESITNNYTIYNYGSYTGPSGTAAAGANISAAATAAAYAVMQNLYPALSGPGSAVETQYNNHIAALGASQSVTDGLAWGQSVASGITGWRATDGAGGAQSPYTVSGLGHWQQTDPLVSQPLYPSWGDVTPFAIGSTNSVFPSTPGTYNPLDSSTTTMAAVLNGAANANLIGYLATTTYANDYNNVKDIGSATSLTRNVSQTEAAYFWNAGANTVSLPGMWNEIANELATDAVYGFNFTLEQNAALFAALNVSLADAGIASWDAAYTADFWRPTTAIAFESDPFGPNPDNNPLTSGEAGWAPLLNNPDTPSYTDAHSTFSAAAGEVLQYFFERNGNVAFMAESDVFGDGSQILMRNYSSISDAVNEAGLSRIYGGVNFASADSDGRAIGAAIGDQVANNLFQQIPEPSGALLIASAGLFTILRRRSRR